MPSDVQHQGLVLTCNLHGEIEAVIADDFGFGLARHVGESFVRLVDAASIPKALSLLSALAAGRAVAAWELNAVLKPISRATLAHVLQGLAH